jgi:hypothetical protein
MGPVGGRSGDTLGLRADEDVQVTPFEVVRAYGRPEGATRDDIDLRQGRLREEDGEQRGNKKTLIHRNDLPGGETRD